MHVASSDDSASMRREVYTGSGGMSLRPVRAHALALQSVVGVYKRAREGAAVASLCVSVYVSVVLKVRSPSTGYDPSLL